VSSINIEQVWTLLRQSVGVDESVSLGEEMAHRDFAELGYDSLAVLHIVSRIEQEYGVSIDEDAAVGLTTAADIVTFVNQHLGKA
jgi:minimal PKS acyl carrier protein